MSDQLPTEPTAAGPVEPEQAAPAKPEAYADRRCREAGIPDEICLFKAPHPRAPDSHQKMQWSVFSSDDDDNLVILYPTIGGDVLTYDNGTKNNPESIFERKRLKVPRIYIDPLYQEQTQKYTQPKGTRQFPFFMPGLVAKYQAGTKIPTLYLVEGELKAAAGVARGLDVVGLPSNQVVREQRTNGHWHLEGQLEAIIRKCQVETLVLLHDADALTVKWERDKRLDKRPNTFAQAVINFREAIQGLIDDKECELVRAYYMHGKRVLCEKNAKGLDDVFIAFPNEADAIKADLAKGTEADRFFNGLNVTTANFEKVKSYFGVSRKVENAPLHFYKLYRPDIGDRQFVLWGQQYMPDGDEVQYVAHADSARYARVGADWFKIISQLRAGGEVVEQLEVWKVGEIQRDYKQFPRFLDECPKYDGFTVEPNFNGQYQRVVAGNLNLVTQLTHQPRAGSIKHTLAFLKHIFGGEATLEETEVTEKDGSVRFAREEKPITADPFTIALDWLTVAHNQPKHQLPVIILVSKENKTGKTTFLNFLTWIYGTNATVLNNAQFAMKFNAHYASKIFIGLDEAFQDLEKKAEKERLKQMVTAKEMQVERKGVDLKPVPFYGKIVMTSNDAEKVMKLDDGETRWFVVKVPALPDEDVDMEAKLRAEIPAWLHFLHHREAHHPRQSRLWFKPEDFITEQFKVIVNATKNRLEHTVEEFIKEMFLMYRLGSLKLSVKWLVKAINETSKYRIDEKDMREYLKTARGMSPSPQNARIRIPLAMEDVEYNDGRRPEIVDWHSENARFYRFEVTDWLNEEELKVFEGPWGEVHVAVEAAAPASPPPVATTRPATPGVQFGAGWQE